MYLFYSNRRREDAAFLEDLRLLEKSNATFRSVCIMINMPQSKREWHGNTGKLNIETLSRHLSNLQSPIYYVAGPPAMVAGMRKTLVAGGVDGDDIRTEDFGGY